MLSSIYTNKLERPFVRELEYEAFPLSSDAKGVVAILYVRLSRLEVNYITSVVIVV